MTTASQAHVAEVLGDRDAGVDAGLARHHRHVGGVGDDHGALGQPAAGARVVELGQLGEHVGHLVAALAAADVDDHVGVAPLGDLLQQHGLAGAEPARHRGGAAPGDREQHVEHPLPGEQRRAAVQPLAVRPRPPHRPGRRSAARPRRTTVAIVASSGDRPGRRAAPSTGPGQPGRHQHPVADPAGHGHRCPGTVPPPTAAPAGDLGRERRTPGRPRRPRTARAPARSAPRTAAAAARRRRRRAGAGRAGPTAARRGTGPGRPGARPPVYS